MAAALRCAARRLLVDGRGFQRTPAAAAREGQRRLSPSFIHGGPSPSLSSRRFFSDQRGDRPLTFEEKVALWKRGGHLLFRATTSISTIVASYYVLKLSLELAVSEFHEHGYIVRRAASQIKKANDKLRSFRNG